MCACVRLSATVVHNIAQHNTATEHFQLPLYESGTVFCSISHLLRHSPSSALAWRHTSSNSLTVITVVKPLKWHCNLWTRSSFLLTRVKTELFERYNWHRACQTTLLLRDSLSLSLQLYAMLWPQPWSLLTIMLLWHSFLIIVIVVIIVIVIMANLVGHNNNNNNNNNNTYIRLTDWIIEVQQYLYLLVVSVRNTMLHVWCFTHCIENSIQTINVTQHNVFISVQSM